MGGASCYGRQVCDAIGDYLEDIMAKTVEFKSRNEADSWMAEQVDNPYGDNERFAFLDDAKAMSSYTRQQNSGCCGFFDREIQVAGRAAMIGCNYGH
jgi:hypothetical protein